MSENYNLEIPKTGMRAWLKHYRKQVVFGLIIFFISTISFGLGYLINRENHPTPIIIEKCSDITEQSLN